MSEAICMSKDRQVERMIDTKRDRVNQIDGQIDKDNYFKV